MRKFLLLLAVAAFSPIQAAPPLDESDPLIAATIFYAQSYGIERMQQWCKKQNLGDEGEIARARAAWDKRHASLWDKVPKILQSRLTREERISLASRAKKDNEEIEAKVAAADRTQRSAWCIGLPSKIGSHEMNLMERPVLVKAVTNFSVQ